jgi:hypothetical protein
MNAINDASNHFGTYHINVKRKKIAWLMTMTFRCAWKWKFASESVTKGNGADATF